MHQHIAAGRRNQSDQNSHQRRFAATAWTKKGRDVVAPHLEADVVQYRQVARARQVKLLAHAAQLADGFMFIRAHFVSANLSSARLYSRRHTSRLTPTTPMHITSTLAASMAKLPLSVARLIVEPSPVAVNASFP